MKKKNKTKITVVGLIVIFLIEISGFIWFALKSFEYGNIIMMDASFKVMSDEAQSALVDLQINTLACAIMFLCFASPWVIYSILSAKKDKEIES